MRQHFTQCPSNPIVSTAGKISYLAHQAENCDWIFELPERNLEFVLVFDLFYFETKRHQNYLELPDGTENVIIRLDLFFFFLFYSIN